MTPPTMSSLLQRAETILGHPMGKRKTDPHLAYAAIHKHLGFVRRAIPTAAIPPLRDGYALHRPRRKEPGRLRRLFDFIVQPNAPTVPRLSRAWYLRRAEQEDQGETPHCVGFTETHWELCLPVHLRTGLGPHEMYARAKQIDGYPTEDGTDAHAMIQVCQSLGLVESAWWYTGVDDREAAIRWLIDIGPLWLGVYLPESFFRTDNVGNVTITPPFLYGHEMLVVGYDGRRKRWQVANSWGILNWGLLGRGFLRDADFWTMLGANGDLCGVAQTRKKAAA